MDFFALAAECAPTVHQKTIAAIVHTESAGNPWAIGINGAIPPASFKKPTNKPDAVKEAKRLIEHGYNIDLGLGQINSANLSWLGMTVEQIFDPCTNLQAAAYILTDNYTRASKQYNKEQASLAAALSAYNTGNFQRGITNGYVKKIYLAADNKAPVIMVPAPEGTAPKASIDTKNNPVATEEKQMAQAAKLLELLREMQNQIHEEEQQAESPDTTDPAIVFPSENTPNHKHQGSNAFVF